jgi:hypothetical protein
MKIKRKNTYKVKSYKLPNYSIDKDKTEKKQGDHWVSKPKEPKKNDTGKSEINNDAN